MSALWPLASRYQEAMQNPSFCITDPELRQGNTEKDRNNMPVPYAGGYGVVFKIICAGHNFALKCFLNPSDNRMVRYQEIDKFVESENNEGTPWEIFKFIEKGILVGGISFPTLKMGWVDGLELHKYIAQHLQDNGRIGNLATQFKQMVQVLEQKGTAHGDLQHGNIIIRNSEIKLIDYDDMYIPSLKDKKGSGLGHPNYSHPLRKEADYGPDTDHFSSLVIYLSMLALSKDETLWKQYHSGENLILKKADFIDPDNSPCLKQLQNSQDKDVANLAVNLNNYCKTPPRNTPSLNLVLDNKAEQPIVVLNTEILYLPPTIIFSENKIISPSGNEIWEPRSGHDIIWKTAEDYGDIDIYLYHEALKYRHLISKAPSSLGSIFWRIPLEKPGNSYRIQIRIAKTDELIEISEPFTILPRSWARSFQIFKNYDCSWCKRFYTTQPWECYERHIRLDREISKDRDPKCKYLEEISASERNALISDERWWFLIWEGIDSAHLLPTEISNEIVTQCKIHDCAYNPKTGCPLCNSIIEKRHPLKPDQLPPIAHIKPGFKLYSGCYWEKLPKDYLITSKIKTMTDDGGIWAIVLPEKALYTAKEWQSIKDSLKHLYETEPPDVVKQREKLLENVKRNEDLKRGANQTNLVKDPSKSIQASAEETKKPRSDTCDLFCPYCGKPIEVDEKATFCPNCGKKLLSSTNPGMKFCPKCGNNLGERPQGTFCSKCGADLKRLLS